MNVCLLIPSHIKRYDSVTSSGPYRSISYCLRWLRLYQLCQCMNSAGQFTEAYKNYDAGLDADKRIIELQANAAMASLKIGCPVQAIEHCDQVFRLAEFLLDQVWSPPVLCLC